MARAGVTLILDGLTLTSADTASITYGRSSQVTIEAAAGTVNMLSDSEQNNDDMYPTNENAENAVLKCKDGSQVDALRNRRAHHHGQRQKRDQIRRFDG